MGKVCAIGALWFWLREATRTGYFKATPAADKKW